MGNYIKQIRISFEHFPRDNQNELSQNIITILNELDIPVSLFYSYYLRKVKTQGISMITIYFTSNKEMNNLVRDGDGNMIAFCFFDREYFMKILDEYNKKLYYVEIVNQTLLYLASIYNWETTNFNLVRNSIVDNPLAELNR